MADLGAVKLCTLNFGTSGTSTVVASIGTNTSNPQLMPRGNYSVQVTANTTGTSGVGATVVVQGSNDNQAWVALGSATCTASQASTSTSFSAAAVGVNAASSQFVYSRAVVGVTGTGNASAFMGV